MSTEPARPHRVWCDVCGGVLSSLAGSLVFFRIRVRTSVPDLPEIRRKVSQQSDLAKSPFDEIFDERFAEFPLVKDIDEPQEIRVCARSAETLPLVSLMKWNPTPTFVESARKR